MTREDFEELGPDEQVHFYECSDCKQMVDMRQLDDVFFHEDHLQRADIPYSGWERLKGSDE